MKMVQILISTYNGSRYLEAQLNSIFSQSYKNINILVRDNGSTDNTILILSKYYDLGLLDYYVGPSIDVCARYFDLIFNSPYADYYSFSDQDDIWFKDKIKRAVYFLENESSRNNTCILYTSQIQVANENLKFQYYGKEIARLSFYNSIIENTSAGFTMVVNNLLMNRLRSIEFNNDIFSYEWYISILTSALGTILFDNIPSGTFRKNKNKQFNFSTNYIFKFNMKRKLLNYFKKKDIIRRQAAHLYYNFTYELPDEYLIFLEDLFDSKKSFNARRKIAKSQKFYRQSSHETKIFKLLMRLGQI